MSKKIEDEKPFEREMTPEEKAADVAHKAAHAAAVAEERERSKNGTAVPAPDVVEPVEPEPAPSKKK